MARPQLEDGHTQIANEILEHLMRLYLAPNQWQVLLCIIRKTYGFHKKVDYIANFQIVEATGLLKSNVSRVLKKLEQRKVITRNGKHIGFQKDWEQWDLLSELITKVIQTDNLLNDEKLSIPQPKLSIPQPKLSVQSTKVISPRVTQKKKETIQKKLYKRKGEFQNVILTDKEYQKLIERFGESGANERIEALSIGIESRGYKYQSHYAAILNWERRNQKEKGGQGGTYKGHSRELKPRGSYLSPDEHRKS